MFFFFQYYIYFRVNALYINASRLQDQMATLTFMYKIINAYFQWKKNTFILMKNNSVDIIMLDTPEEDMSRSRKLNSWVGPCQKVMKTEEHVMKRCMKMNEEISMCQDRNVYQFLGAGRTVGINWITTLLPIHFSLRQHHKYAQNTYNLSLVVGW